MSPSNDSHGFTLIELMLAMTFISLLLIAIAMTTMQISNIYTKGMTFKSVNQAGRVLSDDLRQDITASAPFDIYEAGKSTVPSACGVSPRYIRSCSAGKDVGGRLCLGDVSYVWNYGQSLGTDAKEKPQNFYSGSDSGSPIRLVRVMDKGGLLCVGSPLPGVNKSDATEILAGRDQLDLALQNFSVASDKVNAYDASSNQRIYVINFTVGTNDQNALTTGNTCVPPNGDTSNWEYCAVNTFTIVVRAGN